VAGHSSVVCFSRSFADQDLGRDELLATPLGPGSRHPQRPSGPQTSDEFASQRATPLDIEGLVDGLVRDAHGLILREVDPQPVGDLLGAPRRGPPPVLTAPVTLTAGQHAPIHAVVAGDPRVSGLFAQGQMRVTVTTSFQGPAAGQPLNGRLTLTELRADVIARHHTL
jgi:hypothetical protein